MAGLVASARCDIPDEPDTEFDMNMKVWLPLVLALLMGGAAIVVGKKVLLAQHGGDPNAGKFTKVYVVREDVEPGHALVEEDIRPANLPNDSVPRAALTTPAELVGRVTARVVVAGSAVTEDALTPAGTAGGLQAVVPAGMRALTLEVNEYNGMTRLLVPGSRVDVMGTLRDDKTGNSYTRTLVPGAKVLAVGKKLGAEQPKVESTDGQPVDNSPAKSVTMLVSPRDAAAIELATDRGRTRLVLRSPQDATELAGAFVEGITVADLIGGAKDPQPAIAANVSTTQPVRTVSYNPTTRPAGTAMRHTIRVIRAGVESQIQFEMPREEARRTDGFMTGADVQWVIPDTGSH